MTGFIGELFRTFKNDVSCMRYALDAMMLEVGSFPNSKSWKEAKKEVDKVWTPQMRELFAAESGNMMEEQEKYVEEMLDHGLERYMEGNGISGEADHMSMLDLSEDFTLGLMTKYQNPGTFRNTRGMWLGRPKR